MKNFRYSGKSITIRAPDTLAPHESIKSGEFYEAGDICGILAGNAKANEETELYLEGVFALPKERGVEIPFGKKAYWNSAQKRVTLNNQDRLIGVSTKSATATDMRVDVRLNGVFMDSKAPAGQDQAHAALSKPH